MLTVHGLRTAGWRLETTFVGRCVGSFLALKGIDRAMAIAAQAFTALIPLVLLAAGLAPADRPDLISDAFIRKFHLAGSAADAVRAVFAPPAATSTGVFSVVLLVLSGVSLARRIQRMYQDAWQLAPSQGVRGSLNAALALTVLLLDIGLLALARTLVSALPAGWELRGAVTVLGSLVLWTAVPWLLLDRRIAWRRLLPTGALTAVCASSYAVATTVYMPRQMDLQPAVRVVRGDARADRMAAVHRVHHRGCDGGGRRVRPRPGPSGGAPRKRSGRGRCVGEPAPAKESRPSGEPQPQASSLAAPLTPPR